MRLDLLDLLIISAVLFNIGSILFILDAYNKIKFENRTITHFKKIGSSSKTISQNLKKLTRMEILKSN